MRFLVTTIPGFGHFQPVVPLARALQQAGHDVAVVTAAAFRGPVSRAGLTLIPGGLDWDESRLLETLPEVAAVESERQGDWMMKHIFLDRSPRKLFADLPGIVSSWRPDVVVSGTYEFAGPLVAEKAGLPYASCSISFRWNRWLLRHMVGRPIARLRREIGLAPDPLFEAFGRHLDLAFVPPAWSLTEALLQPALTDLVRGMVFGGDLPLRQRLVGLRALGLQRLLARDQRLRQALTTPTATHFIRHLEEGTSPSPSPFRPGALPGAPTVYISLGTVFGAQYPQVFQKILDGLRDEPMNLILTVGSGLDPARFGPQPPHVQIAQFIPPEQLRAMLPHVDLCITHSGYGTVMDALTHGVPMVLLPLAADQPVIAQMCLTTGVAVGLPAQAWRLNGKGLPIVRPDRLTPGMLREAARRGLQDPAFRRAARAQQSQLNELPGVGGAVRLLEQLGAR